MCLCVREQWKCLVHLVAVVRVYPIASGVYAAVMGLLLMVCGGILPSSFQTVFDEAIRAVLAPPKVIKRKTGPCSLL